MNFIGKRINLIGIFLLLSFTVVAAGIYFDVPARLQKSKPTPTAAESYVCPMHPDVVSAKPGGKCPKCGMALVAASKAEAGMAGCGSETGGGCCATGLGELRLPPGHPPVPGFTAHSGCDHSSDAVTNSPK